jgi:hypothetical protein
VAELVAALTGKPLPSTPRCLGIPHGDAVARGYLTVDVVNACTDLTPADQSYFLGVAQVANVLLGDFVLEDRSRDFAVAHSAVHIEADPTTYVAGDYTFYGRYVAWSAVDRRESLATNWVAPYDSAADELVVWRDTKLANVRRSTARSFRPGGRSGRSRCRASTSPRG